MARLKGASMSSRAVPKPTPRKPSMVAQNKAQAVQKIRNAQTIKPMKKAAPKITVGTAHGYAMAAPGGNFQGTSPKQFAYSPARNKAGYTGTKVDFLAGPVSTPASKRVYGNSAMRRNPQKQVGSMAGPMIHDVAGSFSRAAGQVGGAVAEGVKNIPNPLSLPGRAADWLHTLGNDLRNLP